jgi:hypothetical protein
MKLKYGINLAILILILLSAVFIYKAQFSQSDLLPQQQGQTTPPTPLPEVQNKNPTHPLLILEHPQENQVISSPLSIVGKARGGWFFEATFPVVLTDWNGLIIAEGFATAQGDWMTEEFVPFMAELAFTSDNTVSSRGSLILQKANASGLPENDDAYEITVVFNK